MIVWNVANRKINSAKNDEISNHLNVVHDTECVRYAECVVLSPNSADPPFSRWKTWNQEKILSFPRLMNN